MTVTKEKKICPDCGPATVNHFVAKTSIILGFLIRVITAPLGKLEDVVVDFVFPKFEWVTPLFFKFLSIFSLVKITDKLGEDNIERTKCLWNAAEKRGIKMTQYRILNRPTILFTAEYDGQKITFEGLPRPINDSRAALDWMDNKAIMKKKFLAGGIPVAKGGVAMTTKGALRLFRNLNHPVIAKPNLGSRSRHTTTHINTEEEMTTAFKKAVQLSPWVVVEEELTGFVHRITLIGGKLVGALRREPPFVTGDGIHSIKELVETENKNPKRHSGIFHEIAIDADADAELLRQKLTWDSVPEKERFVTLNQKVGRGQGGSNTEMLPFVHPENIKLFEKLAKVLNNSLVGVDFIMQDVRKPWTEQKLCGAIECNSLPFLDLHHMPLYGEALDPSSRLWEVVFPGSKIIK
jgi:cyanophycin synthetase